MRLWIGPDGRPEDSRRARRVFIVVFCLVLATRLPFIGAGYGYDPDAWRVMKAARTLAQTGEYQPTRYTGYPVVEFVYSFLWDNPGEFFGVLTALMTSLGIAFLGATLVNLGILHVVMLCLAVACTPVVYVASTTPMDYLWALTFVLVGFGLAVRGNALLAGLLLGIATGCRFTSFLMVVPLGVVLWHTHRGKNKVLSLAWFLAAASFTTVLIYLPTALSYTPSGGSERYPKPIGGWNAIFKGSVGVWGVIGCAALLGAMVHAAVRLLRDRGTWLAFRGSRLNSYLLAASGITVVMHGALFIRYPFESAYLIPIVPFVFIGLSLLTSRRVMLVTCALTIASPFFLGISRIGNPEGIESTPVHMRFRAAHEDLIVDVLQGPVLLDRQRRHRVQELIDHLYLFADTTRQKTVVVVQWFFPQIEFERGASIEEGTVVFVEGLTEDDVETYKRQGYQLRYLRRMDATHLRAFGVDLASSGAKELNVLPYRNDLQ